jgi:hypothetical protein
MRFIKCELICVERCFYGFSCKYAKRKKHNHRDASECQCDIWCLMIDQCFMRPIHFPINLWTRSFVVRIGSRKLKLFMQSNCWLWHEYCERFYFCFQLRWFRYEFCRGSQSASHERGCVCEALCHDGSEFEVENQRRNLSHPGRIFASGRV